MLGTYRVLPRYVDRLAVAVREPAVARVPPVAGPVHATAPGRAVRAALGPGPQPGFLERGQHLAERGHQHLAVHRGEPLQVAPAAVLCSVGREGEEEENILDWRHF